MTKALFKGMLTTNEAADILGVSLRCVQLWCNQGKIQFETTPGGHRRISRQVVLAFKESMYSPGTLVPTKHTRNEYAFSYMDVLTLYTSYIANNEQAVSGMSFAEYVVRQMSLDHINDDMTHPDDSVWVYSFRKIKDPVQAFSLILQKTTFALPTHPIWKYTK